MVYVKTTDTGHHQQDTDYYCMAATAQMILNCSKVGAGLLDQNVLFNTIQLHHPTPWEGLCYALNTYKPQSFDNFFVPQCWDTERRCSEKIVDAIYRFDVPTGTLVFDCGHFIAVIGFSTDVEPAPGTTYAINGLWINNPWPPVPSFFNPAAAPPPPHSQIPTDGCGTGGNRGIANEYVSYEGGTPNWKDTYLTGCDLLGDGHRQYASACDPEPPKMGKLTMKRKEFWAKGDRLITSDEAEKFALKGIEEHNLPRSDFLAGALEGARPAHPILVHRLDLPDTFYYLVPMRTKETVTAIMSVDGLYGNFSGGLAFAKPLKTPFLDREEAMKKVLRGPIELGGKLGKLIVREGVFCFYPVMVWRPCCESRSPYYPFYMITVGSRSIYVGYDGTIYPELHDLGIGGVG